jgi:hypothetical protein
MLLIIGLSTYKERARVCMLLKAKGGKFPQERKSSEVVQSIEDGWEKYSEKRCFRGGVRLTMASRTGARLRVCGPWRKSRPILLSR